MKKYNIAWTLSSRMAAMLSNGKINGIKWDAVVVCMGERRWHTEVVWSSKPGGPIANKTESRAVDILAALMQAEAIIRGLGAERVASNEEKR